MRDEASLRAYVQVYFAGAGLDVKVEHHNAHGRSDLEVNAGNRHWIFEFKIVQGGQGETEKLLEAVEQIKQKHYHNAHGRSDLEVNAGNRHWIFEFKIVQGGQGETEKLLEAVEQIKQKHYRDQQFSKELKKVALVFSVEARQFVKWQEV